MINIVIQHSVADMFSGASYSLLGMVKEIKKHGKYNPIVILPLYGGKLEEKLKEAGIECYPVVQHDVWSVGLNDAHSFKNFTREVVAPIRSISGYRQIKKILIERDVKLVHVNMLTCGMVAKVANDLDIPVVWHIREFLEEDIGAKIVRFSERKKIINKSKRMIAISHAVEEKFQKIFTPPIDVIYNGVEFSENDVRPREILNNEEYKVAIVGRICKNKGQLELVEALELLHESKALDYRLYMYGNVQEKEYFAEIQNFVKEYSAENRVFYMGRTANVLADLRKVDILCVCSNKEAFGRTTIEGMLSGCLVIGSDSGGTKELIIDGKNGYKYKNHDIDNFAEIILKATSNKKESRMLAHEGQRFAISNFSVSNNANSVMNVYDKVLDSSY